jgi:hypothetical protein
VELPRLRLVGEDGNAFSILGRWRRAAKNVGWTPGQIAAVHEHATSGDYNHLLVTIDGHCIEVGTDPEEDDTDY